MKSMRKKLGGTPSLEGCLLKDISRALARNQVLIP